MPINAFEEKIQQVEVVSEIVKSPINERVNKEEETIQIIEEQKEQIQGNEQNQIQEPVIQEQVQVNQQNQIQEQYMQETTFTKKPSLWQRFKNSKFVNAIRYITKVKIVIDYKGALPEGRGEQS